MSYVDCRCLFYRAIKNLRGFGPIHIQYIYNTYIQTHTHLQNPQNPYYATPTIQNTAPINVSYQYLDVATLVCRYSQHVRMESQKYSPKWLSSTDFQNPQNPSIFIARSKRPRQSTRLVEICRMTGSNKKNSSRGEIMGERSQEYGV